MPTLILSGFLVTFLIEEKRQILCLKFLKGPVCCANQDQFIWAFKRKYLKIIDFYAQKSKEEILNQTSDSGGNWYEYLKEIEDHEIMKFIMEHEKFDKFVQSQNRQKMNIFLLACQNGDLEMVKAILDFYKLKKEAHQYLINGDLKEGIF